MRNEIQEMFLGYNSTQEGKNDSREEENQGNIYSHIKYFPDECGRRNYILGWGYKTGKGLEAWYSLM